MKIMLIFQNHVQHMKTEHTAVSPLSKHSHNIPSHWSPTAGVRACTDTGDVTCGFC